MTFVRHHFLLLLAALLLLSQNAFADSAKTQADGLSTTSTIEMPVFTRNADCIDFINENPARVSCGFIQLPVNHQLPASESPTSAIAGSITLPILIAGQTRTLTHTPSKKAILIPGGGGPGASIGFGLAYQPDEYLDIYSSLRAAGFDLVILDQRGAGLADPVLRCPETATAFIESVAAKQSFKQSLLSYRTSLNDCRKRWQAQNLSLQDFDTNQSAKDYLAIINSLPYEWWGVIATSYATVIAQEMEILKPNIFNRIVLDSPVAIDYQRPFTFELTEASIDRILSLCEITRQCNTEHKNIKAKFQTVRSRFKKQPVQLDFEIYQNEAVQNLTMQLDDTTLLDMLIISAYSNYGIAEIPWIIDGLFRREYSRLNQLAVDYWYYNTDLDYASALAWIIHCKERQPMEQDYLRRNPGTYDSYSGMSQFAFDQEKLVCSDWLKDSNAMTTPMQNNMITTETLIIAGDLDPVIDREDIANTANHFTDKQVQILAGTGHSVWFQSACTRQNTVAFFTKDKNSDANLIQCNDGIQGFK